MTDLVLTTHDATDAPSLFETVRDIYAEVYAEAPYHEGPDEIAGFTDAWGRYLTLPGFRLVIASQANHPVGMAFGHVLPVDTDWWDGTLTHLPEELTRERAGRTFAIIELAVRRPYRRQRIATQMHDQLVAGTWTERVTLLVRPEPETAPARAAYTNWGYHKTGDIRPGPDTPIYDLMIRQIDTEALRSTPS